MRDLGEVRTAGLGAFAFASDAAGLSRRGGLLGIYQSQGRCLALEAGEASRSVKATFHFHACPCETRVQAERRRCRRPEARGG